MIDHKVYGFIGPISGGKSYRFYTLKTKCEKNKIPFIGGDFSDGIRDLTLKIFGFNGYSIDLLSPVYSDWKNERQNLKLPIKQTLCQFNITGRELLKNVGENLKIIAGKDIWAKWTLNDILRKREKIPKKKYKDIIIAFGSIRFEEEIYAAFKIAEMFDMDIEIIFCNYSQKKSGYSEHISERLPNKLLEMGCKDGDNVTNIVKDFIK